MIDGATNRVLGTLPGGANPYAVAVDPDSGDAYVANYGSHPVTKLDLIVTSLTSAALQLHPQTRPGQAPRNE